MKNNMEIYKNLDGEIWKDIFDYGGEYQVSNFGRIKSFKQDKINGKIMKQYKRGDYFCIDLYKNGISKTKDVHRLIFESHNNYKLKSDEDVHHINEDKENNIFENLEKMPKSEHISFHMKNISKETRKKLSESKIGEKNPSFGKVLSEETIRKLSENSAGEKNGNSVLTNKKVIQIKMLFKLGFKNKKISIMYSVDPDTISNIRTGKTWNHIVV
jgi:hypothetical protein